MFKRLMAILASLTFVGISFATELSGAGATFPYPLYSKMFSEYYKLKKVEVNYQPIGSGGGVQQLINRTVDFGGTDAPLNEKEEKAAKDEVIHIPTCLGAVVLTYNLPGNPTIKLTPEIVVDIYLGKITKWNDPRITEVNPDYKFPDLGIVVVRRSDGSGTTFVFSEYLASVSEEWKTKVGVGKSLNWPVGIGGKGNPGVAGYVKQTPGAIGYVEVAYAKQNKMPYASLKNKSGNFVLPTLESISKAADVPIPAHTKVSLVNTDNKDGYPIVAFTWIIAYKEQGYGGRPKDRAKALKDLLYWMVTEGQKYNEDLDYGKLPEKAQKAAVDLINSMIYNGKPIQ